MDSVDTESLLRLKNSIEKQLQWGETTHWRSYDFEKLSEKIQEETGVILSISTLKRVFGKVSYGSSPSVTTLNTLSQFVGFEDWRSFCNVCLEERQPATIPLQEQKNDSHVKVKKSVLIAKVLLLGFIILLAGSSIFYVSSKKQPSKTYSFSSKTILTAGLPNSVVFDYDATAANENDSVFIAQAWDVRRKVAVSRTDKHHSSIYYYPGYFRAKLMVGQEIVKEHDIQIKTDGWLGLIEADWGKEPFYFKQKEIVRDDQIAVDDLLLQKYHINISPEPPPVRLYNQKDIHGILTDHFTFETELKSDFNGGNNACQPVEVLLQSKNDILIVPLVNPSCIGNIYLAAYGFYTDSKKEDLSGFGCNLQDWVKLKIVCTNRQIRFLVNGKEAYTTFIPHQPTEIVGVQYRFKGPGAVRNTRLSGRNGRSEVF